MYMSRIIVSVDGNINTGKTTLTHMLGEDYKNFFIAKEYEAIKERDVLNRQLLYMRQDQNRVLKEFENIILDRSIISLLGYSYWLFIVKEIDIRKELYDEYVKSIIDGNNEIPNRVIICHQSYENVFKEYCKNKYTKGTDELYVTKQYYDVQEEYLTKLEKAIGDKVIKYNYADKTNTIDIYDDYRKIEGWLFLAALRKAVGIDDLNAVVSVEGISAVGKSSLCKEFEKKGYLYVPEYRCIDKCADELDRLEHQVDYFIQSLQRYKIGGKKVIDNGILENIVYTFFLAHKNEYGISFVEKYLQRISELCTDEKIDQMIFLYMEKDEIVKRKKEDISKVRDHFDTNIEMWKGEMLLSRFLSKTLDNKMFVMIEANQSTEDLYKVAFENFTYAQMEVKKLIMVIYNNRKLIYGFFGR